MSNSSLISYTKISPNRNSPRNHKITTISIHHMAGNLSVEQCGAMFAKPSRKASSNYGIGSDGRIAMYVPECDRSWCSSNRENDHKAVTIEVANCGGAPDWPVSDKAYAALLDLVTDICKRNGIDRLNYTGDTSGNLTMHKWFTATACPGPYLEARFPAIADAVNARLSGCMTAQCQVGDVVHFVGSTHYGSASATSGCSCKPGPAKVTAIKLGAQHPYHVVHTDGTSNVYGWVNASDLAGAGTIEKGSIVHILPGAVYGGLTATRGKTVPARYTGSRTYTVQKIATHKGVTEALLKEICSWVAVSSLEV